MKYNWGPLFIVLFCTCTTITIEGIGHKTLPTKKHKPRPSVQSQQSEQEKQEDRAKTQAAVNAFFGVASSVVNIIQNHDDPQQVSNGAHGIISGILNIIAAARGGSPDNIELQIELLTQLEKELRKFIALKNKELIDCESSS